jgi:DNA repair photolyase
MPLKKTKGNMYEWVTHTWNVLCGKCPHECDYCYVAAMTKRFPSTKHMYEGVPRFNEDDRNINLGKGKKIFVAHTGDLFADDVPDEIINEILDLCNKYPENEYVLQTKNPYRYIEFLDKISPKNFELGTTVETDDVSLLEKHSKAPTPLSRVINMAHLKDAGYKTFITVEPVMKMIKPDKFGEMLIYASPDFINIGADSKKISLPEPTWSEIQFLIKKITDAKIEIRLKTNLERLKE